VKGLNADIFTADFLKQHAIVDWGYTEQTASHSFDLFQQFESYYAKSLPYLTGERGDKRKDLKCWDSNVESALVFLFDYSDTFQKMENWYDQHQQQARIASYVLAYQGLDYHDVLKTRLLSIGEMLKLQYPDLEYRIALDTHPVLERDLAYRAGLGWIGKNSMHIHRRHGSTHLIGSLMLTKKINVAKRDLEKDHCGTCTACIQACPTEAIDHKLRTIHADRCISTFTIEMFKPVPSPDGYTQSGGDIFGCDICQEVCPWNNLPNQSVANDNDDPMNNEIARFFLKRKLSEILNELEGMSNGEYRRRFKGTPLERTGRVGMLKNIRARLDPT
jgi:epoxyqueuosine reductase